MDGFFFFSFLALLLCIIVALLLDEQNKKRQAKQERAVLKSRIDAAIEWAEGRLSDLYEAEEKWSE